MLRLGRLVLRSEDPGGSPVGAPGASFPLPERRRTPPARRPPTKRRHRSSVSDMALREALVAVSAVQLATGLAGQVVALRRRHPYDTPIMGGRPENVGRDSFLSGTALSAPVVMLAAQAWAVRRLHDRPDDGARR